MVSPRPEVAAVSKRVYTISAFVFDRPGDVVRAHT